MRRPIAITRFAVLVMLLLLPASVRAQGVIQDLGPVVWRMRGTLVADQKTASDMGFSPVSLGFTGQADTKTRWFGAVHAEMFGGDTFDAWSYVNGVSHYNPTFTIVGPPEHGRQAARHAEWHARRHGRHPRPAGTQPDARRRQAAPRGWRGPLS